MTLQRVVRLQDIQAEAMPDPKGKTVLDIGGFDGRHAVFALIHEPKRYVIVDKREYRLYNWKDPPELPGIDYHWDVDFMDWYEPADIVLFHNVIYHCRDYRAALAHLRTLTRETLCFSTSFVEGNSGWRLYSEAEGTGPNDKGWHTFAKPTLKGLRDSLLEAGFTDIKHIGTLGDHTVLQAR